VAEPKVRVFYSRAAIGALASGLPADLVLDGRALVLAGGWLPYRADAVAVVDPTAPRGVDFGAGVVGAEAAPAESVHAEVLEGRLHVSFVHDSDVSGYCCFGIAPLDAGTCPAPPALPPLPDPEGPLRVTFLVVPTPLAADVVVARTMTLCGRP
jgi:hypothetical protein